MNEVCDDKCKSISGRILEVFKDGPGFSSDVIIDTGWSKQRVSSNLSDLSKRGKLLRKRFHLPEELRRSRNERMDSHEWVWLYSLPSYSLEAAA